MVLRICGDTLWLLVFYLSSANVKAKTGKNSPGGHPPPFLEELSALVENLEDLSGSGETTDFLNVSSVTPFTTTVTTTSYISTTTPFDPVFPGQDPCSFYVFIDMADGFRSSDFLSCNSDISLCDSNVRNDTWYRFEHDAGNQLLNRSIDPWFCGTQAPIYLNETYHINEFESKSNACAAYSANNTCGWSGQVFSRRCELLGESFYVYLLAVPPACPLAYCVDASTHRQCVPPEEWISDEFRCGVPTSSASPTPSAPCVEPPDKPGWSEWGAWSECTKTCDYGLQSRKRVCGQIPCANLSTEFQTCNEFDCPIIPEETEQGITINLKASDVNQDSLMKVIENEEIVYEQLRLGLNDICSRNGDLCCGDNYTGYGTKEYVTLRNVYRASGGLTPNSDGTISLHVIAVANGTLCALGWKRIMKRETKSSSDLPIPYETMKLATYSSAGRIYKNTGLVIVNVQVPAPAVKPIDNNSCELTNCILPIIGCVVGAAAAIIAAVIGVRYVKNKDKQVEPGETDKENKDNDTNQSKQGDTENPPEVTIGEPETRPNEGASNNTNNKKETDSSDNSKTQPVANDSAPRDEVNIGASASHEEVLRSLIEAFDPTIREIHEAVTEIQRQQSVHRQTSHLIDETIVEERTPDESTEIYSPSSTIYKISRPQVS